jgi:hypothetical protein
VYHFFFITKTNQQTKHMSLGAGDPPTDLYDNLNDIQKTDDRLVIAKKNKEVAIYEKETAEAELKATELRVQKKRIEQEADLEAAATKKKGEVQAVAAQKASETQAVAAQKASETKAAVALDKTLWKSKMAAKKAEQEEFLAAKKAEQEEFLAENKAELQKKTQTDEFERAGEKRKRTEEEEEKQRKRTEKRDTDNALAHAAKHQHTMKVTQDNVDLQATKQNKRMEKEGCDAAKQQPNLPAQKGKGAAPRKRYTAAETKLRKDQKAELAAEKLAERKLCKHQKAELAAEKLAAEKLAAEKLAKEEDVKKKLSVDKFFKEKDVKKKLTEKKKLD